MKYFTLRRVVFNSHGTFGVLIDDEGIPFALTLENPWEGNKPNISCIPAHQYVCKRIKSPKFGHTFEITNVEDRTHILFHKGNTSKDTHGCILIGEQFEYINGIPGIAHSGKGYDEFMKKLFGHGNLILKILD